MTPRDVEALRARTETVTSLRVLAEHETKQQKRAEQPTHWMPLPEPPAVPAPEETGEER